MKSNWIIDFIIISISGMFDANYYLLDNDDVRSGDINPVIHFARVGWKEGRNPSGTFDTHFYLATYEDVSRAGVNPLVHYILYGRKEGRLISDNQTSTFSMELLPRSKPARRIGANLYWLMKKGLKSLFRDGPIITIRKMREHYDRLQQLSTINLESAIRNHLSENDIKHQKEKKFDHMIKFSIVVPLYNTRPEFLRELVNSVLDQTYQNWELCIADGSDLPQVHIQHFIEDYEYEPRIKYKNLSGNHGIALNTVAAYEMSTGEYIVLMDHDDILAVDALYELANAIHDSSAVDILYSDRLVFSDETKAILAYHFLPGFSPDYLRSMNYMSHLIAYSRKILHQTGFLRPGYEGSQDHELLLRCIEVSNKILHIPRVLYLCRASQGSVALNPEDKMYAYDAGKKAISEHIHRIGYPGDVEFLEDLYAYRIHYKTKTPRISIIIPNRDHAVDLQICINSILKLTTYPNYDIKIVENNSQDPAIFDYYDALCKDQRISVLSADINQFNFSYLNNFAVQQVDSEYIILLNNDTEVITPNWIEELLMFAQRADVGAVGAKLLYPDNTIQHCGLVIGLRDSIANNYGFKKSADETGYMHSLVVPQNYSAVTAACLMVSKANYMRVGGLDEIDYKIGLNDVDFCLKLRDLGLFNVWTPYAKLYHLESKTRGSDEYGKNKTRYSQEISNFKNKWRKYFDTGDPFQRTNYKGW